MGSHLINKYRAVLDTPRGEKPDKGGDDLMGVFKGKRG